jgi:site-specific DNA-methyltransferase (adenine-specific)
MALQKAMVSSKSNEWDTPLDFFNELNKEFNFTLDPCCREDTAKCSKFYTINEDGLKQDWSKDIVFMNPPYGGHTGDWIKKAYEESLKGATVVCLIVSSTDRSYWHDWIFPFASQVRFIRGRIKFGNSKSTAPFASAVVIFSSKKYNQKIIYYSQSWNKTNGVKRNGLPPTDKSVGIRPTIL